MAIRSEIKQTFEFLSPENRPISSIIIVHAKVHSKLQAFFNERFLDQDSGLESRVGPTICGKNEMSESDKLKGRPLI